ncbi:MAG: hypothetical protein AB1726_08225 [Planctomycetota bacterium]
MTEQSLLNPRPGRIGFDASSLNILGDDPQREDVLCALKDRGCSPVLTVPNLVEILKWPEIEKRDALLELLQRLRRVDDLRLLPFPLEVVEAEVTAWSRREPNVTLGSEQSAEDFQALLEDGPLRSAEVARRVSEYADLEQKQHEARLRTLRDHLASVQTLAVPSSAKELVEGVLNRGHLVAAVLNACLGKSTVGPPVQADEAVACARDLPILRAFLVTVALAIWHYGVQAFSLRRSKAAGAIDIMQATYLPLAIALVVDDQRMRDHLRTVVDLAGLSTLVVTYDELRRNLQVGGRTASETA